MLRNSRVVENLIANDRDRLERGGDHASTAWHYSSIILIWTLYLETHAMAGC